MKIAALPFDIHGYLVGKGGRYSHGDHGPQMMITCPWCSKFGGFYVALEDSERDGQKYPAGTHVCFKCGKKSRSFIYLYSELEGVSFKEARVELTKRRAGHLGRVIPRPKPPMPKLEPTTSPIHPDGFKPCWDEAARKYRMPRYLLAGPNGEVTKEHRGITRETARAFGLGWCEEGRYANRVVIPIVCPIGSSFTTRTMDPDEPLRFLAGPGAGKLLIGWPQAQGAETLIITEGPFDTMSIYQACVANPEEKGGAVGLGGKSLRQEQIGMIRSHPAKRVILMLDGDALDDALRQYKQLGSRVAVAGLLDPTVPAEHPDQLDPGDCSTQPERIWAAIRAARDPALVRVERLQQKVRALAARAAR